jgi:putative transposase
MSKLTYKVKHTKDLSLELQKAQLVADFALKTKSLSSKDVKHIGLKSAISCQILRKYSRNKTIKSIKSNVKLIIPGQVIFYKNNNIYIRPLKMNLPFDKHPLKICQIELDSEYAYVCCEVQNKPIQPETSNFIGIDRNATGHIAVCSMGSKIIKLGKEAPHINRKYKKMRAKAQKKKVFSFLKKVKNKEARKTKDINHKISKHIVTLAKDNNYDIKLEDLGGIRKKNKGKKLNGIISNWSFYQLQTFIEYKAKLYGVRVFYVDPAYTSQTCSKCGLIGTREKKVFQCQHCKHKDHADANASFCIAQAPIVIKKTKSMKHRSTTDSDVVESQTIFGISPKINPDMAQMAMDLTSPTIKFQHYLEKVDICQGVKTS